MTGVLVRRSPDGISARWVLAVLLVGGFVSALLPVLRDSHLSGRGLEAAAEILAAAARPSLDPAFLARAAGDAVITVSYAILAMAVAAGIGVPAGLVASGRLGGGAAGQAVAVAVRGLLGMVRAIHELVWALLFVTAAGLVPAAGVLAIGIPYAGIVGRIVAERLQDVPGEPLEALGSLGHGRLGTALWGRFPMAGADLAGYLVYRFECSVRAAAVLSFVGLGGLGFRIETVLKELRFDRMWTLVYVLVVLVVGIDWLGRRWRKRISG